MRVWLTCLAVLTVMAVPDALAQMDVDVQVLDGSILATFTASEQTVDSIVVWFEPGDATINKYVADPQWSINAGSESVRIYGDILQIGESAKIGIRIDGDIPPTYWSASLEGAEVQRGWLFPPDTNTEPEDAEPTDMEPVQPAEPVRGVLPASEFYTIPAKPAPGYDIRLVGSGFGPRQVLELDIGRIDMGTVTTDASGGFVASRTIPNTLNDRVDFTVSDQTGTSASINIRLSEASETGRWSGEGLQINPLENTYQRGERIDVSGTASPLSALVLGIHGPDGASMSYKTVITAYDGVWSMSNGVIIPLDAPLGKYVAVINDGEEVAETAWVVESDKTITINAIRAVFQPGDVMAFSGTAIPNVNINMILQDPGGAELLLDSWIVDSDGSVWWEFATDATSRKGTYTLIASQGAEREFVYAGLGAIIEKPTIINFDKANYLSSETPGVVIVGMPGDDVTILILDDSDSVVHRGNATIQQDGRAMYDLDIGSLASGVYTAIAQAGTVQDDQEFGVGLSTGTSTLDITVRADRNPGDPVHITGTTNGNVVVSISLIDPDGNTVQTVQTLVGKTGMLSEQRIRIPADAKSGTWTVKASSGPNSDVAEIAVVEYSEQGLAVTVDESQDRPIIAISGAGQGYATVTITEGGAVVVEPQRAYVTSDGEGHLPWSITVPGIYTITVESGSESASYTYTYTR